MDAERGRVVVFGLAALGRLVVALDLGAALAAVVPAAVASVATVDVAVDFDAPDLVEAGRLGVVDLALAGLAALDRVVVAFAEAGVAALDFAALGFAGLDRVAFVAVVLAAAAFVVEVAARRAVGARLVAARRLVGGFGFGVGATVGAESSAGPGVATGATGLDPATADVAAETGAVVAFAVARLGAAPLMAGRRVVVLAAVLLGRAVRAAGARVARCGPELPAAVGASSAVVAASSAGRGWTGVMTVAARNAADPTDLPASLTVSVTSDTAPLTA